VVTVLAQLLFPFQANGSLLTTNGVVTGSRLIGQSFTDPKYFFSRPSATTPYPYNAGNSSGSNLGPSNPDLINAVKERTEHLSQYTKDAVPVDLVTASGSGLDPDISPAAAYYQTARIAKLRHIPERELISLIDSLTEPRSLRILGEPRVNVLLLNAALDTLRSKNAGAATKS
jgi:K+-transporting ATPase ATPase C chain